MTPNPLGSSAWRRSVAKRMRLGLVLAASLLASPGVAQAGDKEDDSVPHWIDALRSPDGARVVQAAARLSIKTYKGAHAADVKPHLTTIAGLLRRAEPEARSAAVEILLNVKASEYVSEIGKRLDDEAADVKQAAIHALARFHANDYTKRIAGCLEDKDLGVRGSAVDALGFLGAKEYAAKIVARLEDEHHWVRGLAASALAKLGKEHAGAIARLLRSREADKINALYALRDLKASEHVAAVAEQLKDAEYTVRLAALRYMAAVADDRSAPQIVPLLKDENGSVRTEAESLLKLWKARAEKARPPPK